MADYCLCALSIYYACDGLLMHIGVGRNDL